MKIISDPLLQFIVALSIGGFMLSVGLQYNSWIIAIAGGVFIIISYLIFIPLIHKKQKEENDVSN